MRLELHVDTRLSPSMALSTEQLAVPGERGIILTSSNGSGLNGGNEAVSRVAAEVRAQFGRS